MSFITDSKGDKGRDLSGDGKLQPWEIDVKAGGKVLASGYDSSGRLKKDDWSKSQTLGDMLGKINNGRVSDISVTSQTDVKLAQVRGSMPAGWAEKNLPNAKITLFDNYPDAMRAIAQGRADAIVDVVDFLGEHMNKHKNVEWQVVDKAIDTWYCGIGVKKGNSSLQQWLNVALYTLHRADFVDQTWEKWFGIRQIHSVEPQPYF